MRYTQSLGMAVEARHGWAWHGETWQGKARHGMEGEPTAGAPPFFWSHLLPDVGLFYRSEVF